MFYFLTRPKRINSLVVRLSTTFFIQINALENQKITFPKFKRAATVSGSDPFLSTKGP
jgi:hypothetical protein